MKTLQFLPSPRLWLAAIALVLLTLTACATGPKLTFHAFTFDGGFDKWAAEVDLLEYSYGDQYPVVRRKASADQGTLGYSTNVNGPMPVGDFLYVRWRIKSTKEIVEDKVDLRNLLPGQMSEHKVTFVIDGKQLYVYLVTPKVKKVNTPPILKTYLSKFTESYEIYPNNTYKQ